MVAEQTVSSPDFSGTKKFKDLAGRAYEVLRAQGMFVSEDSPIVVTLDSLTAFLVEREGAKPADVRTAIEANSAVFVVETRADVEVVITTRNGRPPLEAEAGISHSFPERFMKPEPKPERPPRPIRERVKVDPNWATFSVPDYVDEDEEADLDAVAAAQAAVDAAEQAEADQAALAAAQAAQVAAEDVQVIIDPMIDPLAVSLETVVETEAPATIDEPAVDEPWLTAEEPLVEQVEQVSDLAATEPAGDRVDTAATIDGPATSAPEPIDKAPVIEPDVDVVGEPVQPVVPAEEPTAVPNVARIDLSGFDDADISTAIASQLGADSRSAHFAGQWMVEERVPRLSRGDLRRAKEYIQEQEQPLTDATLAQDILGVRPNSVEFNLMQFAVNYRLSKEHRDFDFVGTNGQRFWSTSSLPQIGTTRRKPNEIGTDYRFLTEETGDVEYSSVPSVDHVLSFYEFSLGLLPYNDDLKRLLAKPVSDDQRSAVLTFEIPQSYTTYLVELRYPTPNRGGFLLGLDDFYAENLVPGAVVSISATENDGHYKVEFLAASDQNARLLELDDRRSPRYLFRPTTYHCDVATEWLISEDRFPKLGSEKPLDDKVRRRPEAVVAATFERMGIEDGDSFVASFEDLLAAVNIERPFSETLLRTALERDGKVSDDGSGTYTYVPGS